MSILKEILAWFNTCRMVGVFGALLLISAASLSAACFELESDVNLDSKQVLVNQIRYNVSESDVVGTMYGFLKSGLLLLRENPLKALTIFLAMQGQGSLFSMPGASAQLLVSNINQTHVFDIRPPNPVLKLSPMGIAVLLVVPTVMFPMGIVTPCNATIVLSDMNAGNLRSTGTGLSQTFNQGVWNSHGDNDVLSTMLSDLRLSIAADDEGNKYDRPFKLSVEVYALALPGLGKARGTIQIMPSRVASTTNTPVTTTLGNTTRVIISTTLSATGGGSVSSSSGSQSITDVTVDSEVPSISSIVSTSASNSPSKTNASSFSDTTEVPLVDPAGEPLSYIIGGVAAGAVCLGSIAIVVAIKRGWCGTRKKSTTVENLQESPPDQHIQNKCGKLVLEQEGYQKVPLAGPQSHYATSLLPVPRSQNAYSTLAKAAQEGACDLIAVHLDLGCQIDELNEEGFTPLHLAAREGHLDACEFLIARGAHKALANKDGKTALQLAQERGHNDIVFFLENSSTYQDLPTPQ
jgi:hypothetical protein